MSSDFQLIDSGWSNVFKDAIKLGNPKLRIVCPFIKKPVVELLFIFGNIKDIQVITRFSLADFSDGVSDTSALRMLLEKGAQIRGVRNLHSKLYLFGENRAVVTSANLTEAALLRNHEFGFVAGDPSIITSCSEYFENLWLKAGNNLAVKKLDEWDKKIEVFLASGARPSQRDKLGDEGVKADFATDPEITPPSVTEAKQAFVKFFGISSDRASLDLPVITEVKRAGCHWACTYPKKKRPSGVKDGAIMFMARLVENPNDIIIFGRAAAMKHKQVRDEATPAEIQLRPFKSQWPNYIRVHHAQFVAGTMLNGISLNKMMNDLKASSFASTLKNEKMNSLNPKGEKQNTDPRKAYMQQAHVELSAEGFEWLNKEFEKALELYGRVPETELEKLDWP